MTTNPFSIATQTYAQYNAQLIKVSHAQSDVNATNTRVDCAKQEALLAQRNLDCQNAIAKHLMKKAIVAGRALGFHLTDYNS